MLRSWVAQKPTVCMNQVRVHFVEFEARWKGSGKHTAQKQIREPWLSRYVTWREEESMDSRFFNSSPASISLRPVMPQTCTRLRKVNR